MILVLILFQVLLVFGLNKMYHCIYLNWAKSGMLILYA